MALIGILGDAHGEFEAIFDTIKLNPDVERWFQVGDLGGKFDSYPSFPENFHFIQGNHENWDYVSELKETENPLFLPNGSLTGYKSSGGMYYIGALGGNYSAKQYKSKTESLQGDRRRHFTEENYESLIINKRALDKSIHMDVLLTHEAPSPFTKGFGDIGIKLVTELLQEVKPDIHFFGHHHSFKIMDTCGIVSVGLGRVTESYVLYDTGDKRIRNIEV
jgi:predicted phosphodiesterase